MGKQALLVIDMLNDFIKGSLKCDRAMEIVPNLVTLVNHARRNNIPVIFSNDEHTPDDNELKIWDCHAMKGTEGAEVISEFNVNTNLDYIVPKRTYSPFFQTNLDSLLKKLDVDTLIITGIHAHICVLHACVAAYLLGYKIVIPTDCVTAFTKEDNDTAINYIKSMYNPEITTSENIIKNWK